MVPGENKFVTPMPEMCATSSEPQALCIVWDVSSGSLESQKAKLTLPASTTGRALVEEVGRRFCYEPDSFQLVRMCFRSMQDRDIVVDEHGDATLEEMGFRCGNNERNSLIIESKNSQPPRRKSNVEESRVHSLDWWKTTEGGEEEDEVHTQPPPAPPPYTPVTPTTDLSYNSSRQETGYVGLVNQAMTCYLNSLLQTLYMTPEFRNALYRWEFDGTEEEGVKSIPFQLQKLFLNLQTSRRPAVGTTELTTSFGWDSSEAWQQHDVQELCRVMFDALEQKFKNTGQSDLISTLYEGKMKDYVKCLQCNQESAREDTFLDVPLVVRPFGSSQSYASVEEALGAFVAPETLQGGNQYWCEGCGKKCDAHKGLRFLHFPYLLTLQLKRFDFDPATMHRRKLNDRVTFPEVLSLNEFIKTEAEGGGGETESRAESDDEGIDVEVGSGDDDLCMSEANLKRALQKGPYVYELFSIMVHSGNANGGHYYAYIKSFENGEWYCFNDAQVTSITYEDIQKTYGGGQSRGYYSYSISTNAYMLMYRQVNKQKNAAFLSGEELPEHIRTLLQRMLDQEERERQQRELDRSMCKLKLFCQHPTQKRLVEMKMKLHKDCSLQDATQTAHTILGLEGVVGLDCCRLVSYDKLHDSLEDSLEDVRRVGELTGHLFLETRQPHHTFQEYKPGGYTVKVHVVDLEKEEVALHPLTLRSHPSDTVADLQAHIAQALGVGAEQRVRIVREERGQLLQDPRKTLAEEGFRKSNKVFAECSEEDEEGRPYAESKLFRVLDTHLNTICVHVALPKVDKDNPEWLRLFYYEGKCEEETPSTGDADEGLGDSECSGGAGAGACSGGEETDESERTLVGGDSPGEPRRYFRAWKYTDYETAEKMLRVYVDKRITLAELKMELEPYTGVKASNFKMFRVYSNNQEFECTRLSDNLMSYGDDSRLTIKLGRALRKGEYRVRIFQLCPNEAEPLKFLLEWVVVKGQSVLQAKREMLPYLRDTCGIDIPPHRCRLRKKSWKNPGPVYLDHQCFQKDIPVNTSWEMFLQVLDESETVTSEQQSLVFVRRWQPSLFLLHPLQEVILHQDSTSALAKLSEISNIPEEFIEVAKGQGTFPCEVSLLTIQKELLWTRTADAATLHIDTDGLVLYYRDCREEAKKLTEEEKREIQSKENAKYSKYTKSCSPRKEKALKIYTLDSAPSKAANDLD